MNLVWFKENRWLAILLALLALVTGSAVSETALCRYTIRDLGFVNVGVHPWTLEESPGGWVLNGSPEGEIYLEGATKEDAEVEAWESPMRNRLVAESLDTFAFVLLVEGTDQEERNSARMLAQEGVSLLRDVESQLPRPLAGPTKIFQLPFEKRQQERVLLASWGLRELKSEQSALVVSYGRLKRAGPPLMDESMTEQELVLQLALVGESCECETPRDWVHEPRAPHKWNLEKRQQAALHLGFDPESPMVLAEVSRILARGSSTRLSPKAEDTLQDLIFGYREDGLSLNSAPPVERVSSSDEVGATSPLVVEAAEGDWGFEDDAEDSSPSPMENSQGISRLLGTLGVPGGGGAVLTFFSFR